MSMGLILRKILILIIFFSAFSQAEVLHIDNFNSNTDGWSGSNIQQNSGWLYIPSFATASKTFDFGSSYANLPVTIKLSVSPYYGRTKINANGTEIYNNSTSGQLSVNTTFDNNGRLKIDIKCDSTYYNYGYLYIDYISLEGDRPTASATSDFSLRYQTNLKGNMKVIGNTVLCPKSNGNTGSCIETTLTNDKVNLRYTKLGSDSTNTNIFNSSSATLQDSSITLDTNAKIVWAGLYWSGYLHTYDSVDGTQTRFTNLTSNSNTITNVINNHTIKFRSGNKNYDIVNSNGNKVLGMKQYLNNTNYKSFAYSCFADVTDLLKGQKPTQTYSVANVPAMEGHTRHPDNWQLGLDDGLGNSGAWSLVVIYENSSTGEKTRNATVFDGFVAIDKDNSQAITVSGFLTPKSGAVDSTLSVFANEGDKEISGDNMIFTNLDGDKSGQSITLKNSSNATNNFFDSSISGVPERTPKVINNNGIDIHTEQMGGGGYNIIGNNQTAAKINLTSTGDMYFPSMVAFATELYVPDVCYDYAAYLGEHIPVPVANDRTFSVSKWGEDPLNIKVFIRSKEADFDLQRTGLIVDTNATSKLAFNISKTEVSPPYLNSYYPAIEVNATTHEFSIGKDNTTQGGTIGSNESIYAKAAFDFKTSDLINGSFDVTLKASIALDPTNPNRLTPYSFSTKGGNLDRCPTNVVYDPIWLRFNIEREDSTFDQLPQERYPLHTQVAGREFAISVASYGNPPSYTTAQAVTNPTTLDLEIIDVTGFQNDASAGYDSICDDPFAVGKSHFVKLNSGEDRTIVSDLTCDTALQAAAFRVWVLTRPNESTIVPHSCTSPLDEECFQSVYETHYKDTDTFCQSACGSNPNECYACLKANYATPICSRDNFAIRPDGFKLSVSDKNQTNETEPTPSPILVGTNAEDTTHHLAAGYNYLLSLNALKYDSSEVALGYYNDSFKVSTLKTLPTSGSIAALEFKSDATCNDTAHRTYRLRPLNGTYTTPFFAFDNVGDYDFWVLDTDWTLVDQASYPYKPLFGAEPTDDCILGSASSSATGMVGCDIRSVIAEKPTFKTFSLHFHPYTFGVNGITMSTAPNSVNSSWLYTNNLEEDARMGVLFDGNLTALNAKGNPTSNFTGSCAATDVLMDLNITTDSSLMATNLNDASTKAVRLNHRIELNSDNTPSFASFEANQTALPTITADKFLQDSNGSVELDLRYNYTKSYTHVSNPIIANFGKLIASSPDAILNANLSASYMPFGEKNYDQNRTFYYSRVYPSTEGTIPETYEETYSNTALSILVYSDDANASYVDLNASPLNSPVLGWYKMSKHTSPIEGQITKLEVDSANTTITPDSGINFTAGGATNIAISHPMNDREKLVTITITPDAWLKYNATNADGLPQFKVRFLPLDFEWTGVGETGNVIEDKPSAGSKDRTTW